MIVGFLKSVVRVSSQVNKEIIQIVRRPATFVSLVLGPFLIMALFGMGYTGVRRPLETVVVIPPGTPLATDIAEYERMAAPALTVREVVTDRAWADAELAAGRIDLIVEAPPDAEERFRAGERATINIAYRQIDPVMVGYIGFIADRLSDEINRRVIEQAVREGREYAVRRVGESEFSRIPPEVIAQPTDVAATNIAPIAPQVVAFFAPAVLALILQHMAVTLSALSLVRERTSGTMDIFRISPVNSFEIVLGKYIGFGIIGAVIAVTTTGLLVGILGVPLLGDPFFVAGIVALIVLASLGLGLLISVVSDSERQAVQLSLLVLLASVFFGGLVLPVEEFHPIVQGVAYALPVTHGISLLQDLMLLGGTQDYWHITVLAAIALVLFIATTLLLRRTMTRG